MSSFGTVGPSDIGNRVRLRQEDLVVEVPEGVAEAVLENRAGEVDQRLDHVLGIIHVAAVGATHEEPWGQRAAATEWMARLETEADLGAGIHLVRCA